MSTVESQLSVQAKAIADRVDPEKVGFDPFTILTIIGQVLPMLLQCFDQSTAMDDPNTVTARLQVMHDRNPDALRRRTARRIRAEADEPMTRSASFELARATIDQALTASDDVAIACYSEADA